MSDLQATRAVDVRVHGEVQGVGYRFGTVRRADELGVTGWVRNESDGDVTAHLEGPDHRVESMLGWMRSGTRWASVSGIDVEEAPVEGFDRFEVR